MVAAVIIAQQPVYGLGGPRGGSRAGLDLFTPIVPLSSWWVNPTPTGSPSAITYPTGFMDLASSYVAVNKHAFGIRQPAPTGSFSAMAKLAQVTPASGGDLRAGVYVGVSGAKGHICGPFAQDNAFGYIGVTTINDGSDWSAYDGTLATHAGTISTPTWFRIQWNALTSGMSFDYSSDRVTWTNISTRASMSQPTEMGLVLFANGGGLGGGSNSHVSVYQWAVTLP